MGISWVTSIRDTRVAAGLGWAVVRAGGGLPVRGGAVLPGRRDGSGNYAVMTIGMTRAE